MSKLDFVFLGLLVGLWFLWRIVEQLKAIRTILERATNDAARGRSMSEHHLSAIANSMDDTERLLARAIKKQWGSAINSIDAR